MQEFFGLLQEGNNFLSHSNTYLPNHSMILREATIEDIAQLHVVRTSVLENQLSNPNIISLKDYEEYLAVRGKGCVIETENIIAGFAVVDLLDKNVWALFVHPVYERKGFGRLLHNEMIGWYFTQTANTIWLSTGTGTRAEMFYRKIGWKQTGLQNNGELRLEMTLKNWKKQGRLNY